VCKNWGREKVPPFLSSASISLSKRPAGKGVPGAKVKKGDLFLTDAGRSFAYTSSLLFFGASDVP